MTGPDDHDHTRPVSQRAIEAVAAETGTSPTDLEPLYSVVDPDALDDLFHYDPSVVDGSGGHVAFNFAGCRVQIFQDGTVETSSRGDDRPRIDASGSTDPTRGTRDRPE